METWRLADLHAYVDDCLEPNERRALEKQMTEDAALARRAAAWRAQNSAIRSAFDGEGARAFSISIVRHQNGSPGTGRRPASIGGKTPREQLPRPPSPGAQSVARTRAEDKRAPSFSNPAVVAARPRRVVYVPFVRLGPKQTGRPRYRTRRGRRRSVPHIRPSRRRGGRIRDQRHGKIARVADCASRPPGLPTQSPGHGQPGRVANRSFFRRRGRVSRLSVGTKTHRLAGPVSRRAHYAGARTSCRRRSLCCGMDVGRPRLCFGRRS